MELTIKCLINVEFELRIIARKQYRDLKTLFWIFLLTVVLIIKSLCYENSI